MSTVEDILRGLGSLVVSRRIQDEWNRNFISNVQEHVLNGKPLSTNQGAIVLKIAARVLPDLSKVMRISMDSLQQAISSPVYRNQPYQSISVKREVRYLGEDKLAFRFKLDSTVVSDLKSLRSANDMVESKPAFNQEYRLWVVQVTPGNLEKVFQLIQRHRFDFDEGVLEYMTLCTNSKKVVSTFVQSDDGDVVYANVCNNPLLAYVVEHVMMGEKV